MLKPDWVVNAISIVALAVGFHLVGWTSLAGCLLITWGLLYAGSSWWALVRN
jgi:hypothetical protein